MNESKPRKMRKGQKPPGRQRRLPQEGKPDIEPEDPLARYFEQMEKLNTALDEGKGKFVEGEQEERK